MRLSTRSSALLFFSFGLPKDRRAANVRLGKSFRGPFSTFPSQSRREVPFSLETMAVLAAAFSIAVFSFSTRLPPQLIPDPCCNFGCMDLTFPPRPVPSSFSRDCAFCLWRFFKGGAGQFRNTPSLSFCPLFRIASLPLAFFSTVFSICSLFSGDSMFSWRSTHLVLFCRLPSPGTPDPARLRLFPFSMVIFLN